MTKAQEIIEELDQLEESDHEYHVNHYNKTVSKHPSKKAAQKAAGELGSEHRVFRVNRKSGYITHGWSHDGKALKFKSHGGDHGEWV